MSDTSPEAAEVQLAIYRRMTGEERLRIAMGMSRFIREVALSRIRSEHPEWSERECKLELIRILYGDDVLPPELRR